MPFSVLYSLNRISVRTVLSRVQDGVDVCSTYARDQDIPCPQL